MDKKESSAAARATAEVEALDLAVVIPVKDEEGNIRPLLDEIAQALDTPRLEVVCVDDGSTDGTAAELRAAQQAYPWLRIVRHRESCGQSTATLSGVRAARAPWIVTLDGDGQNPPAEIPSLIAVRDSAAGPVDMIAGQRMRRHDDWLRRISSRIANGIRSRLLRDGISDTGCSLKLFRRDAFLALPYFDHMHRYLPALVQRHGGRVLTAPVAHRPREYGQSKYGFHNRLWPGLIDLAGVMWLQRRTKLPNIEHMD